MPSCSAPTVSITCLPSASRYLIRNVTPRLPRYSITPALGTVVLQALEQFVNFVHVEFDVLIVIDAHSRHDDDPGLSLPDILNRLADLAARHRGPPPRRPRRPRRPRPTPRNRWRGWSELASLGGSGARETACSPTSPPRTP